MTKKPERSILSLLFLVCYICYRIPSGDSRFYPEARVNDGKARRGANWSLSRLYTFLKLISYYHIAPNGASIRQIELDL